MNDNNTTIKKALSDIVASYGIEIFADTNRTNALLKDFIPQHDKERKLIVLALREGFGAELQRYVPKGTESGKQFAYKWEKRLVSDIWITEEAAHFVVGRLAEAVGILGTDAERVLSGGEVERPEGAELIKGIHEESENPNNYLKGYQIIGYKAFASNVSLESVAICDSVKVIRSKAFAHCERLRKVEIPSSVEQIGGKAFMGCTSLAEIVTLHPGKYACQAGLLIDTANNTLLRAANTEGKTRVCIPNDIRRIQAYAFDGSKVKHVVLPARLEAIELNALYQCRDLEAFEIAPSNRRFRCIDGVIHSRDGTKLLSYPTGSKRTGYILEDTVIEIARAAFYDAVNLESITFPSGLLMIGEKAFAGCKRIRSIMLPITVANIGERAFQGCTRLEYIMLPRGIREIGDYAFNGCESLETLSIPQSVVRIGNRAFHGCKHLKKVVVQENVSFIGDGAFDGCFDEIEVAIRNNPYAETYCRSRGIGVSKI